MQHVPSCLVPSWSFATILLPCFFYSGRAGMELGGRNPPLRAAPGMLQELQQSLGEMHLLARPTERESCPGPPRPAALARLRLPLLFAALAPALEMAKQALC